MKTLFGAFAILALAVAPAAAQTPHPCDAVPTDRVTTTAPVGAGFCHNGKDSAGNPTTITRFQVFVDGIKVFDGPLLPVGAPSATGFNYYETPKNIIPTIGAHSATVKAVNAQGAGVASTAVPFDITESTPGEVVGVRIIK